MGRKKKKEPVWEPPPEIDEEAEQAALAALLAECGEDEAVEEEKPASAPKKVAPRVQNAFPLFSPQLLSLRVSPSFIASFYISADHHRLAKEGRARRRKKG